MSSDRLRAGAEHALLITIGVAWFVVFTLVLVAALFDPVFIVVAGLLVVGGLKFIDHRVRATGGHA